jgi:hypothetical protein
MNDLINELKASQLRIDLIFQKMAKANREILEACGELSLSVSKVLDGIKGEKT